MVTVDSEGRVTIPEEFRERLDIQAGSEMELYVEGDRIIIEPEHDPEKFWEEHLALIEETARAREERDFEPPDYEDLDPIAKDHVDTIREGAKKANEDG